MGWIATWMLAQLLSALDPRPLPATAVSVPHWYRGCDSQTSQFDAANTRLLNGEFKKALDDAANVLAFAPNCYAAEIVMADALRNLKRCPEASTHYAHADALSVVPAATHFNRAICFWREKQLHAAIAEFRNAVRLDPGDTQAPTNIAWIYAGQRRFDEAAEKAKAVLRIDPNKSDALHVLAVSYEENGFHDYAIDTYDRAVELTPGDAQLRYNRGVALMRKGWLMRAIDDFSAAIKLDEKMADAYVLRGLSKCRLGQATSARVDYSLALKIQADQEDAGRLRAQSSRCREGLEDLLKPAVRKELKIRVIN